MTEVVNIKIESCDIYIGRQKGKTFHFGNPFTHNQNTIANVMVSSREESVQAYEEWLNGDEKWTTIEPERRKWILDNLNTLKGKRLGCFCAPLRCHGDVLKRLVEESYE